MEAKSKYRVQRREKRKEKKLRGLKALSAVKEGTSITGTFIIQYCFKTVFNTTPFICSASLITLHATLCSLLYIFSFSVMLLYVTVFI